MAHGVRRHYVIFNSANRIPYQTLSLPNELSASATTLDSHIQGVKATWILDSSPSSASLCMQIVSTAPSGTESPHSIMAPFARVAKGRPLGNVYSRE